MADFQTKPAAAKLLRRTQIVMLTCHLYVKEQVYLRTISAISFMSLYDIGFKCVNTAISTLTDYIQPYINISLTYKISLYPTSYIDQSAKDTCGTRATLLEIQPKYRMFLPFCV